MRRGKGSTIRRVIVVVLVIGLGFAAVSGLMWSLQRSLIYFPDASPVPPAAEVLPGGEDLTLRTGDGLELGAWFAGPTAAGPGDDRAVLVAPGNGGNREQRVTFARELRDRGFAVLLMDYRGYGGNPGTPSEEGLRLDALAASEALTEAGFPPESTVYFGESLGGGVVARLMSERPPAAAVFRSPFTELADVGRRHYPILPVDLLLRDRFDVVGHVAAADVPVTVIRGDHDAIVPTSLSAEVAAAAPDLVEELVLAGDHNDPVMFGPEVADAVGRAAQYADDR